ncbi:MAG: DUF2817 domain-containing protein [Zetaproteobacteria bacterium CG12_big_fil_rev_8_21_14_0_65_54_13]|nr:MAG: DUF2817 domain-containing protein [Zetaproteobacteria bacterium CG12_big_fil_rev_8_21_14_0_65_54_13]PIX54532.1 MAG: DUF2817 domain-containing protein [Zetaproteobacteria bacterium CG_4_10_14_3_um_filter_54_28]PJA28686.1 MAG: DUF2817 domain-containing protein [Zetaproteobacteria bacterium CG_4_9_14_3_um_filter_54_145]
MSSVTPSDLSAFAVDYRQARAAFLTAATQAGARISTHDHPLTGPKGEALATDLAWLGDADAQTVLVLLSATHGVEGFSGSAAQIDFLRRMQALPHGVAVLIVHAINPHGFAWLRRVNEDGVDLNRNYIDFSHLLPVNAGYGALADAIVPAALDSATLETCDRRLADYLATHGRKAYERALSGGQYDDPHGLFFGGTRPCWSRLISEQIVTDFRLAERKRVALIDFHTGIGPFGYGEPICDHPPGSSGVRLARHWYGDSVTEPALGTSISVAKHGLSDYGWMQMVGEPLVFIALEFGTYPFDVMMQALRADHWLHAQGVVDWHEAQTQAIKAGMRKHFYPATTDWQQMVLVRSRQCIDQALAGLAAKTG